MLNELFAWVLKTYLGKYLNDFNTAQLSIALLSGEVELENVPLKKEAIRSFNIPLQANSGNIGRIKLRIPVRQFRTSGLCIEIDNIYAVFGPTNIEDLDYEKEKNSEYEMKLELLDAIEARWRSEKRYQSENYYSTSYSSWLSYGTSIVTDILENLELKINNVHLRYEDPYLKCCGGIVITSLKAQTCNSNWLTGIKLKEEDISYKLIELKDFAFYWDKLTTDTMYSNLPSENLQNHMQFFKENTKQKYIIHPLTAKAKCKRERCKEAIRSKHQPRLSTDILVTDASISISTVSKITEILQYFLL